MRHDFLNKKLREFIYDHKAFKEALYILLQDRQNTLDAIDFKEIIKDIEDRELANINDLQLVDEDRISDMPKPFKVKHNKSLNGATSKNKGSSSPRTDLA